jgi:hypothetical protein
VAGLGAVMNRKFTGMPKHWRIKVKVDVMMIDSYDNEYFYIHLDNNQVFSRMGYLHSAPFVSNICGAGTYNDASLETFEFEVPHGNSFAELKFSSNLSEPASNESWGVRNVRIYLATDTRWELV